MRVRRSVLVGVLVAGLGIPALVARAAPAPACSSPSWPMYGHGAARTFQQDPGCAAITPANAATLVPKWAFHAADSVTASPAVVAGVVYVGDWAGNFYALDAATGNLKWKFAIDAESHQSAFGRIVSSAAVHDFADETGTPTRVVVFGGGSKLYALDAANGDRLAAVDVDPTPDAAAGRTVEIESSPAIADVGGATRIFVGMDVHNEPGSARTGLLSFAFGHSDSGWAFDRQWKFDPETESLVTDEHDLSSAHGCGGVWSSPAVDQATATVVFGTSSCNADQIAAGARSEGVFAVDAVTGAERWSYRPAIDPAYGDKDADFGASPNIYGTASGRQLVGNGRKDAAYYIFDRVRGGLVATAQVGQQGVQPGSPDFAIGGFIGTPAVDGADGVATRVVGATAIPIPIDSDASGQQYALPSDPAKTTWAVRAIDPETGALQWTYQLDGPSYGASSVANGVVLVPDTFGSNLLVLESATGRLLTMLPVPAPPSSTPVAVGDSVYIGGGTRTTDAEYKSFGNGLQNATDVLGNEPLSPVNGVFAFRLATP